MVRRFGILHLISTGTLKLLFGIDAGKSFHGYPRSWTDELAQIDELFVGFDL